MGPKNILALKKNFGLKYLGPKKFLVVKKVWVQKDFGKHRLCVTIRFLVSSVTADFGWVLLVVLVTGVKQSQLLV